MKLCLTLATESEARLNEQLHDRAGTVDMIEVRLDVLGPDSLPALPESSTEFIATCRPVREGGLYEGPESDRLKRLAEAASMGFDWVDLEYDVEAPPELGQARLIRSRHLFEGCRDLDAVAASVDGAVGDVSKLAVHIEDTPALTRLLAWMEQRRPPRPTVVIGMGEFGRPSRLLGGWLGNEWSYVALEKAVAPGQFTLQETLNCYRLDRWSQPPALFGLLGNPVAHSLSPALHNGLFEHYDLEALYLPIPLTAIEPWAEYLDTTALGFEGFSVTLPFKTQLEPFLGPAASERSHNTLCRLPDRWLGLDMDSMAFREPLVGRVGSLQGWSAVVLGNGGVAATVGRVLQPLVERVTIAARRPEAARDLAGRLGCEWSTLEDAPAADLCVNATPVGQFPDVDDAPLQTEQLNYRWVYDLVYNPQQTRLLEMAEARGAQTISGMEMFVLQAAGQFAEWTKIDPDPAIIRRLLAELG